MASKSELMDHLKMTPIGSLSNFRSFSKTNNSSLIDHHVLRKQVPSHASREAKQAHFQAPRQLPKRHLPRQLPKHGVDLHSPDHRLLDHWDHSHYPQKRRCLLRSRRPPRNVSLPRHQRWSPRNPKPVAIPQGLNLQKARSAPRLGPHDLHQNKEGPGHLQSQHTWLLSRRTGSILLPTSKERNLPSTEQPKQLSMSRLVHISPKSSRASQGLDKNLPGPALLQLDPSSKQGPSLQNLKLRCDRLRTASKSCPCQSSRKTSSVAAHEGPRPSLPEHSPS
ncbi:hypothetical protein AAC387_Pa11g0745 [Persea americana]